MLPSIFGENLFDDFFSDPFGMMVPQGRDPLYGKHGKNLMKTDVRETENSYELDIDLPGFKKDEVNVELPLLLQNLHHRAPCHRCVLHGGPPEYRNHG